MERCWGEKEGSIHGTSLTMLEDSEIPKGAEKWLEFEHRVLSAVSYILETSSNPLIVAHGGVFVVLAKYFRKLNMRADNCSIYYFKPLHEINNSWYIIDLKNTQEFME